jgi:DNA-binding IclR family transcriptional regulator
MHGNEMKPIRTAARTLKIFETLSQIGPAPVSTLSAKTGLAFSTVQRLLHPLHASGWVYRRISENTYAVSYAHLKTMVQRRTAVPLAEAAVPHMLAATDELGLPVFLGKFVDRGIVEMVESTFAPSPDMPADPVYGIRPSAVFGATGLVQLAYMDETERSRHLDAVAARGNRAERQLIATEGFQNALRDAREKGYALRRPDYNPENYAGQEQFWILAVPIRRQGSVLGALSLGCMHHEREWSDVVSELVPVLHRHAASIAESTTALFTAEAARAASHSEVAV